MPTIFSHPAVPIAIRVGLGADAIPNRLLMAGIAGSVLPDLDVLAFSLGIPYEHQFGHRGMSHSFAFAALIGFIGACARGMLKTTFARAFLFLSVATGSHGVLDAFTNGGLGVAFFWPWSDKRYFSPFFRPIIVAPIGVSDFLPYAERVLLSELVWVWVPSSLAAAALAGYRRWLRLG